MLARQPEQAHPPSDDLIILATTVGLAGVEQALQRVGTCVVAVRRLLVAICGDVQVARLAQRLGLEPDELGASVMLLAEPPAVIEQIGKCAAGAIHILLPRQIFGIGLPGLQERQRRVRRVRGPDD
ncbi:hypothetical protein ACQPTN_09405 [Bradyrhizobium sp. 13971]